MCPCGLPLCKEKVTAAIVTQFGETSCDACGKVVAVGQYVHHCDECVFDLCIRCARAKRRRSA